jgi:hypothetical protein
MHTVSGGAWQSLYLASFKPLDRSLMQGVYCLYNQE